ncbi:MAG: 4Fe-4S binding protein [Sandaracinaceae bacterium]|nr:4Fe-4S binding protein [Sandaracinaceae bacterium]
MTRAMAAGLRAAAAIHRTICDAPPLRPPALEERPRPGPLPLRAVPAARRRAPQLAPAERARSFDEVGGVLSHEDARAEAERCLVCGSCANCRVCIDGFGCPALVLEGAHVTVDPALCNGCGVCVDLCPNGAFVLVEGP